MHTLASIVDLYRLQVHNKMVFRHTMRGILIGSLLLNHAEANIFGWGDDECSTTVTYKRYRTQTIEETVTSTRIRTRTSTQIVTSTDVVTSVFVDP